jgi:hypothetical protein
MNGLLTTFLRLATVEFIMFNFGNSLGFSNFPRKRWKPFTKNCQKLLKDEPWPTCDPRSRFQIKFTLNEINPGYFRSLVINKGWIIQISSEEHQQEVKFLPTRLTQCNGVKPCFEHSLTAFKVSLTTFSESANVENQNNRSELLGDFDFSIF